MTTVLDAPVAPLVLGCEQPRLWTRPLRELTPATTLGFEAAQFAEQVLGLTLLPWQRWWLLHALELREDGRFRFRTVLTLVARQNGKTHLLKVVALYFMFLGRARLVLGAAQSLDIAKEAWSGAVELARDVDELHAEVESVRLTNGEQEMRLVTGARYRIAATHRAAGRGLSVDLLILDELREHRDWLAWGALSKTTTARRNAIIVGISNAGDDESVVLNSLRSAALAEEDETLGLFEWSAPDGCELDDVQAWAQANPGLGRTVSEASIRSAMHTDPAAVFRTETLCQRVDALDAAIDPTSWAACADKTGSLGSVRDRVAACIDVAPDGQHVTLAGAAVLDDGRVRVEVLAAWKSTDAARSALPELLARIRPAATAWFPSGPAAALAADLRPLDEAVEIKGAEVGEACQEMADLVLARRVVHADDPLLNAHVAGSQKYRSGEGWRFQRRGTGHVDAAYAAAGAVHAARTMPPPVKKPRSRIF
jgi:hypothetical protein